MKRKNKGITLIALVVTIIILVILAGVSISFVFSNNGIFKQTEEAKIAYEIAEIKDRINITIAGWNINKKIDSSVTIQDLWIQFVKEDIINKVEDVTGPRDTNIYDVTTKKSYVVEIIVEDDIVTIGKITPKDEVTPKVYQITYKWGLNTILTKEVAENSTLVIEVEEIYSAYREKSDLTKEGLGDEDTIIGYFYDYEMTKVAKNGDIINKNTTIYYGIKLWYLHPPAIVIVQEEETYKNMGLTPMESDYFKYYVDKYGNKGYGVTYEDLCNNIDRPTYGIEGYIKYQDISGNIYKVRYMIEGCLKEDTEILVLEDDEKKKKKKKWKKKKIQDITYEDKLLVWDFDKGEFSISSPLWIMKPQTAVSYNLLKFSDGTELCTINQHRIFNKELGKFTYPMSEETPIGTTTYNAEGQEIKLVSKEVIEENVRYYNIITRQHFNLFANGTLTSCRLNNIYAIENMKFVKKDKQFIKEKELIGIPKEYIEGLRLREQSFDINEDGNKMAQNLKGYIQNLMDYKK